MEALGALSYNVWRKHLRQQVAQRIAAEGIWRGPLPLLDAGAGSAWGPVLVLSGAAGMVLAAAIMMLWA